MNFIRNKFRVHGDIVDIHLAYNDEYAIRVEFFGDEIDRISEFDPLTGERKKYCAPCGHFSRQPLYRRP